MTARPDGRRRTAVAAALWFVLAFCIWNVRFDYGVRVSADQFLEAQTAYARGKGPAVVMAAAMRDGIHASARQASIVAAPFAAVGIALCGAMRRYF
jgi:hypothetical protein